eukprot:3187077-Amphidinium_carterae.4
MGNATVKFGVACKGESSRGHHKSAVAPAKSRERKGRSQCLELVTANVTDWGSLKKQVSAWKKLNSQPHIVAVQEHHRKKHQMQEDVEYMAKLGLRWHPVKAVDHGRAGL